MVHKMMNTGSGLFRRAIGLAAAALALGAQAGDFVHLEPASSPTGYLARLLLNENPFPGERGYTSVEDSKAGMLQVLWVLHARMHEIPAGYTPERVAAIRTTNVVEVITAKNQCEGFFKDAAGKPAFAPRVEERLKYLTKIANSGGQPGKFAELLNYGQGLARAYLAGGVEAADRFAGLAVVNRVPVTGRAYSWMTDKDCYHPGGSFVSIPDSLGGSPGGNRFFTLKKANAP
jgi:hypothetical protein